MPVLFGSVGQFKCNTSGDPTPTIEWWLDGKEVIPDNININITYEMGVDFTQFSTLTYKVIGKDFSGVHKVICRARNHAGYNDSTSTLTVEGMLVTLTSFVSMIYVLDCLWIFPVGAEIKKENIQLNLELRKGRVKSESLPCPAYGYPAVKRLWLKGGQIVDVKQSRVNVSTDGSLVIGQVDVADEGLYTCRVNNAVRQKNYTESVTINVTVNGRCMHARL